MTPVIAAPPNWTADAACVDTDPDDFFPDHGCDPHEAVTVCRRCPVRTPCLTWALELERGIGRSGRDGVWGGLGPSQRERLDRQRRRGAA